MSTTTRIASIALVVAGLFIASIVVTGGGQALAQRAESESGARDAKRSPGKSPAKPAKAPAEEHIDPSPYFNFFGSPFEHNGKDMMGGKYGDGVMVDPKTGKIYKQEEPMSAPFIFLVLNFAILLMLLAWKGAPVARKLAIERHEQIKTALDEAAKLRKEAADRLAKYEVRLKDADKEITALVEGIRADAEADKLRIVAAAEKQAAQLQRNAEQRIAAEIETARAMLTREVTAAATAATEQLLREKVNPTDQQKLVASFIGEIQSNSRKEAR